jgi:hypothetical protein
MKSPRRYVTKNQLDAAIEFVKQNPAAPPEAIAAEIERRLWDAAKPLLRVLPALAADVKEETP